MANEPDLARDGQPSDPIDVEVGKKMLKLRKRLRVTSSEFASLLMVSQDKLLACEEGRSSATPSMLVRLSRVTQESLQDLLEVDLDELRPDQGVPFPEPANDLIATLDQDSLELITYYHRIDDREIRTRVRQLVKALSEPSRG